MCANENRTTQYSGAHASASPGGRLGRACTCKTAGTLDLVERVDRVDLDDVRDLSRESDSGTEGGLGGTEPLKMQDPQGTEYRLQGSPPGNEARARATRSRRSTVSKRYASCGTTARRLHRYDLDAGCGQPKLITHSSTSVLDDLIIRSCRPCRRRMPRSTCARQALPRPSLAWLAASNCPQWPLPRSRSVGAVPHCCSGAPLQARPLEAPSRAHLRARSALRWRPLPPAQLVPPRKPRRPKSPQPPSAHPPARLPY